MSVGALSVVALSGADWLVPAGDWAAHAFGGEMAESVSRKATKAR